jgi:UDP-glucuronate 4-epimerase
VYGANTKLPFSVRDNVDHPISLYAASKKANELMAHAYSHLYRIPATGLRFFPVYGPWGRPDMAMFIFAKAILAGEAIKLFNHGKMRRDFTYIDDVSQAVIRLIDRPPQGRPGTPADSATSSAPWKIYNVENNRPEDLMDVVSLLEGGRRDGDQGNASDTARRCRGNLRRYCRARRRHRIPPVHDNRRGCCTVREMVS